MHAVLSVERTAGTSVPHIFFFFFFKAKIADTAAPELRNYRQYQRCFKLQYRRHLRKLHYIFRPCIAGSAPVCSMAVAHAVEKRLFVGNQFQISKQRLLSRLWL